MRIAQTLSSKIYHAVVLHKSYLKLPFLEKWNERLATSYSHPLYAQSLHEFGEPRQLPRCGGWIIVRTIPGTPYKDAMGCYPLFGCRDWTRLCEDLDEVGSDLISLAIVPDPFLGIDPAFLGRCFDVVKPFKVHYIADLSQPLTSFISKSHRMHARESLEVMDVEVCWQPTKYLDDWIRLYDNLIVRHRIKGINAYSAKCFQIQLSMPGMVMFLGRREQEIVGATLVLIQDHVAHFHSSAFTSEGYKIRASYGTHWKALLYLNEQGIRYAGFGGAAGIKEDPSDGLASFKRGWSNERRMVYFCGRVFDRQKYESICRQYHAADNDHFPAYRAGEFASGKRRN